MKALITKDLQVKCFEVTFELQLGWKIPQKRKRNVSEVLFSIAHTSDNFYSTLQMLFCVSASS